MKDPSSGSSGRRAAPLAVAALSSLALAALTLERIPLADWRRPPETPFDLTSAGEAVQLYLFLSRAETHVPAGAAVAFASRPPDPAREDRWRKFARALLPGRRFVRDAAQADAVVVAGGRGTEEPSPPEPGAIIEYETPYGSVWRTRR